MPTLKYRDPVSGQLVPILGGLSQEQMDTAYLQQAGGAMAGPLSVPAPTAVGHAAPKSFVDTLFTGLIVSYAGASAPAGWLLCQGQAVSRTTYAALYAAIGTTYGVGDGSTTFVIPNLKGRLVSGYSSGHADFGTVGKTGGAKTVTLTKAQVPNSSGYGQMHNAGVRTMIHGMSGYTDTVPAGAYATGYQNSGHPSVGTANTNLGFSGGAHSNLQPSINLQYIIRT